jgi:hypothetical protein
MRGSERLAKVRWTHPFLLPLQPLSDEAAKQTFMDITDNLYSKEDTHKILQLTDNMPLAVDLVAYLSEYEGLSNVLTRWETEKTSLLSVGSDRRSNLDISIRLSLSSPQITPDSKKILSLLAILPDGLSDAELVQSSLPISSILSCKVILLATSLAHQDGNNQPRLLVPVREHIQQFLPPSYCLVQCICKHFQTLLQLYRKPITAQLPPVINQITLNPANLQEVLHYGLYNNAQAFVTTVSSILSLSSLYRITGRGYPVLMDCIHPVLPRLGDQLKIQYMRKF